MFTHDTLNHEVIEGKPYITFHPNTILYAGPALSPEAKTLLKSKIGIVWHTVYTGDSFENLSASFCEKIVHKFRSSPSVWMQDAVYQDVSGTATFTKQETDEITKILSTAGSLFREINGRTLDAIKNDPDLLMLILTYNNSKVRVGEEITDTQSHVAGLYRYIHEKYEKEAASKKTEKGKQAQIDKRDRILSFFKVHGQAELVKIYTLANYLVQAKHLVVNKMNQAGHVKTFLKTSTGYRNTSPEGFVAIDRLSGGAVKIVNRMEFSRANFSSDILKGWNH